jgi:hypothetical protein
MEMVSGVQLSGYKIRIFTRMFEVKTSYLHLIVFNRPETQSSILRKSDELELSAVCSVVSFGAVS